MVSVNKLRLSEGLLYFLVWTAIFLVPVLNAEMTSREHLYMEEVLSAWYKTAPYFVIFVIHNNLMMPRFLVRRDYGLYLLLDLILVVVTFALVEYAQENLLATYKDIFASPNLDKIEGDVSFTDLSIFWNVAFAMVMTLGNGGIKLTYKAMRDEQKMAELERHNLQVEMDYLKYQINPHFFMNTLNNIHALIGIDSESAKSAVIELSKMMRYVLYESGSESISLRNDLIFLKNYIELMKIRYEGSMEVNYKYPHRLPVTLSIPPLLFIVLVENAFKHGGAVGECGYVNITISCGEGSVECVVVNSIVRGERVGETGIGLINLRKRLELLYGNKFSLEQRLGRDDYYVKLKIPALI